MAKYWLSIVLGLIGAILSYLYMCATPAPTVAVAVPPPLAKPTQAVAVRVPAQITAAFDGQRVLLAGTVGDESTRKRIVDAANARYGAINVTDSLLIDSRVNEGNPWLTTDAALSIVQIQGLKAGKVSFDGETLRLTGEIATLTEKALADDAVRKVLANGGVVDNQLTVAIAKVQERSVREFLDGKVVEFGVGSAKLTPKGKEILDGVAKLLGEGSTSATSVEVGGHTDNVGSSADNLKLSAARALASKTYLSTRGVAAERMSAKGYGDANPMADNATLAGKSRNRRIEFRIAEGK